MNNALTADRMTEDDLLPQALMTSAMWTTVAIVVASFVFSFELQTVQSGVVVVFKDYGALGGGVAALLVATGSLRDALSPLARSLRTRRLGILGILSGVAVYRVLFGLGLFA